MLIRPLNRSLLCRSAIFSAFLLGGADRPLGACQPGDANNFCAHLDSPSVPDTSAANGRLGEALAFGDFDGDGDQDLAVGAPGQDAGEGRVFVFYAVGKALTSQGVQNLSNTFGGPNDTPGFGSALAAEDFDNDGYDDLAVGAPFQDVFDVHANCVGDFCSDSGIVHLIPGSPTGLVSSDRQFFEPSFATFDMHFGAALAAGKVTSSGNPVLAVGIPGSPGDSGAARPGRVLVLQSDGASTPQAAPALQVDYPAGEAGGDAQGGALVIGRFNVGNDKQLVYAGAGATVAGTGGTGRIEVANYDGSAFEELEPFVQTDFGAAGNGADSRFGAALAVGDFNGDNVLDLAIGAPDRDLAGGHNAAGRVYVAFGTAVGLSTAVFRILEEGSFPSQGPADLERFGAALAGGDFDGDGFDDLAIGAPGEGATDTGFVFLAWGNADNIDPDASRGSVFSQTFVGGSNATDDRFGSVLAARDIENAAGGTDEIAIGVPLRDIAGDANAGMVYVTRRFDPAWIFADGFESTGSSVWSSTTP